MKGAGGGELDQGAWANGRVQGAILHVWGGCVGKGGPMGHLCTLHAGGPGAGACAAGAILVAGRLVAQAKGTDGDGLERLEGGEETRHALRARVPRPLAAPVHQVDGARQLGALGGGLLGKGFACDELQAGVLGGEAGAEGIGSVLRQQSGRGPIVSLLWWPLPGAIHEPPHHVPTPRGLPRDRPEAPCCEGVGVDTGEKDTERDTHAYTQRERETGGRAATYLTRMVSGLSVSQRNATGSRPRVSPCTNPLRPSARQVSVVAVTPAEDKDEEEEEEGEERGAKASSAASGSSAAGRGGAGAKSAMVSQGVGSGGGGGDAGGR